MEYHIPQLLWGWGNAMPLLGHAFVGISTFFALPSQLRGAPNLTAVRYRIPTLLLPIILLIAYLPDIATQTMLASGYADGHLLGHSIWFALIVAALGIFWLKRAELPTAAAVAIAGIGPISHVLLDALQSNDRLPWWPLSRQSLLTGGPLLPGGTLGEVVVIAGCALVLGAAVLHRFSSGGAVSGISATPRLHWVAWSVSLMIVLTATGVNVLRDIREKQFWNARLLVLAGQLDQGLALLESSDRWPFASPPGRAYYLHGLAFLKQGKRDLAEAHFLRSYNANPGYIWVVIDTALFYAQGPYPVEVKRSLVTPFLQALSSRFSGNQHAQEATRMAEKLMGMPDTPKHK